MKKLIMIALAASMLIMPACGADYTDKLTEIDDHVYEVEEYTTLDYEAADAFYANRNDNWGGGCTAVSKMVDGHRLVGRNMDQSISHKCAYIVRTNAGKYRTVGLAYTHRDFSPDLEEIEEKGISEEFYKMLPFACDDVLNDAGLHIEINMRHEEYWPNGEDKFACSGTNPKSKHRVFMFELPRYIGENCKTVAEAKEYVKSLNIYSKNNYWNYCFIISDSDGNSSLLEFSTNEIHWIDEDKLDTLTWLAPYNIKALAQSNFFLNKWAWISQDIKSGEGRFIAIQQGIDAVNSKKDMYELMKKVQYSSYYLDYDECKNEHFDPRSENIGEISWGEYDVLMDPSMEEFSRETINAMNLEIRALTREQKMDENKYWESIFTEVVDVHAQEIYVRMYENEDMIYKITLDKTEKIETIE